MADIVNLNRARKKRAKAEQEKTAQANRVAFGTPKALRNLSDAKRQKADQRLTGHKLENPEDDN